MAKKVTKADLEREIEFLKSHIEEIDKEKILLHEDNKTLRDLRQKFLNDIGDVLRPDLRSSNGVMHSFYNREKKENFNFSEILFMIGGLKAKADEFDFLKKILYPEDQIEITGSPLN